MGSRATSSLVTPVILCGGSGTRLWPLSRAGFPKQFLVLSGEDSNQSLFQQALTRINAIGNPQIDLSRSLIVTNEEYRFLALDQLRELKGIEAILLLEPIGRNTAPALSLAALQAHDKSELGGVDPILVITPADHAIQNQTAFVRALQDCIAAVAEDENKKTIAILGITPTAPETGYGYIQRNPTKGKNNEFAVVQFVEKPDAIRAKAYLADGNFLWNSGMFVLHASTWLAALNEFRPDILDATQGAWNHKTEDKADGTVFIRPNKELFNAIPAESIDYAVIEHCTAGSFEVKMVELDAGWNDLGVWDAVWQVGKQDAKGNVSSGDALLTNTKTA